MNLNQTFISALISLIVALTASVFSPDVRILLGLEEPPEHTINLLPSVHNLYPGESKIVEIKISPPIGIQRLSCDISLTHDIEGLQAAVDPNCSSVNVLVPEPFFKRHSGEIYTNYNSPISGELILSVKDTETQMTGEYRFSMDIYNSILAEIKLSNSTISPNQTIKAIMSTNIKEMPAGYSCTWDAFNGLEAETFGPSNCNARLTLSNHRKESNTASFAFNLRDANGQTVAITLNGIPIKDNN